MSFNNNMKAVLPLPIFLADVPLLRLVDLRAVIFIRNNPQPLLTCPYFFLASDQLHFVEKQL